MHFNVRSETDVLLAHFNGKGLQIIKTHFYFLLKLEYCTREIKIPFCFYRNVSFLAYTITKNTAVTDTHHPQRWWDTKGNFYLFFLQKVIAKEAAVNSVLYSSWKRWVEGKRVVEKGAQSVSHKLQEGKKWTPVGVSTERATRTWTDTVALFVLSHSWTWNNIISELRRKGTRLWPSSALL